MSPTGKQKKDQSLEETHRSSTKFDSSLVALNRKIDTVDELLRTIDHETTIEDRSKFIGVKVHDSQGSKQCLGDDVEDRKHPFGLGLWRE